MASPAALAVFLVVYNTLLNRRPISTRRYLLCNLGLAATLLFVARLAGLSWRGLGVGRQSLLAGLGWGLSLAALTTAALLLLLAVPTTRRWLADERVAGMSRRGLAAYALVRIPLGTVVVEEVAFRGLLYALVADRAPASVALLASSAAFGLWHVAPTVNLLRLNHVATSGLPLALAVTAGVVVTALAGGVLCLLRIVTGGLVAPALVHTATNSVGAVAAWTAQRQRCPARVHGQRGLP